MSANLDHANFPRSGFWRRIGAAIYDLLLAAAVYMVAGALGFGFFMLLLSTDVIANASVDDAAALLNSNAMYHRLYQGWIFLWVAGFYVWFWSKGQTLGMRAWRLKIQHPNGQTISPLVALSRLFWALFGVGNLWILISADKRALQDKMTASEVVVLSMEANKLKNWQGV
ncbi:RDD family protein [Paraferrimonas sp. SM1919]|uniref:RDD family protein n=1 Tax=Paraferrimonas sp. SM1919 TaxID=2662263 RepID=UPI0013D45EC9|nr:RDD family protein [Paraferrimonas sp. SM1919]